MKKLIYVFIGLFISLSTQAQLTFQIDGFVLADAGLQAEPYTDNFPFAPSLGYGFEVGYQFSEDFHLGVFYHQADMDKGAIFDHSAMSKLQFIGLRPSYDLWRSASEKIGLNVGIPLSFYQEEVNWSQHIGGLFTPVDSAAGRDEASFTRIGISPSIYYKWSALNLSFHLTASFFADTRNTFSRMVHYDTVEEKDYQSATPAFYNTSSSLQLSIRYTFH
jgi:hypothetical protein